MRDVLEKIHNYALEEIMGERFGRYSKYIIQDRAIPDVRDGLKPVQRRILYGMHVERNTFDKPYRKSAKTVGHIMGNYHPHGDSSIYEAMVRMSQWWKQNTPYVDMQGNNGSIDGDSPAAMRYTEARLAKISTELLKDIDKDTVSWAPNFDDTELEPTVLPAKFPNLLVNGTTGISAGYATNIPPHNLGEVIDAEIKRIDSPNCHLETVMEIVKGPDFPTGGIVFDGGEIEKAFKTGRGKVVVRAKTTIEKVKSKTNIIITEIPFESVKPNIVRKIDEIRVDKKIEGISEVRDETDKDGIRIVIELKSGANSDLILNYLFKNTDLQTNYNYNMIAIVNRRPKLLGILDIIDAHLEHYKKVVIKRTNFDLATAKKELHINEGLIKAISILDEVIATIRKSKNKADAKENLVKEFDFTIEQAEAIVTLQLYRLTNTDIAVLEEKVKNLKLIIAGLTKILEDENELKKVMKDELRKIKKEYAVPRKTLINEEEAEIKIDEEAMIPSEDVIVLITKEGYVKRTSKRSYNEEEDPTLKEGDYILGLYEQNTKDTLLIFTNLGNYLYLPVHEIPDIKWKSLGKHISNIIKTEENEEVVSAIPVKNFKENKNIVLISKDGMIKQTELSLFKVSRYSKPISCMKLKEGDRVVNAFLDNFDDIFVATHNAYGLWFSLKDVPTSGIKSSGVKAINLKNDTVVSGFNFDNALEYVTIFTDSKTAKRVHINEFEKSTRARRGLVILREVKSNPYKVLKAFINDNKTYYGLKTNSDDIELIKQTEIPILDRYKTGSNITKKTITDVFQVKELETYKQEKNKDEDKEEVKEEPKSHQISLLEIDEELKSIDEIL